MQPYREADGAPPKPSADAPLPPAHPLVALAKSLRDDGQPSAMAKTITKAKDHRKNYAVYLDCVAFGAPARRVGSTSRAHHTMRDNAVLAIAVCDARVGKVRSINDFKQEVTRVFGPTEMPIVPRRLR